MSLDDTEDFIRRIRITFLHCMFVLHIEKKMDLRSKKQNLYNLRRFVKKFLQSVSRIF